MSLGVAVLGMGRWGTVWSAVLQRTVGVELVPTTDEGQRRDFRDCIADPSTDAVVITLPVALHLPAIDHAVASGKPVLCEKPAVAERTELAELIAIAQRPGVIRICQNYRARQWAVSARRAIAQIGTLTSVTLEFAQAELVLGDRETMRHALLADMAIHHLDLLRWLTGQEARVIAALTYRTPGSAYLGQTDITAMLELSGGAPVTYTASWAAPQLATPWDANWRFRGSHGVVEVRDRVVTTDRGAGPVVVWDRDEFEHDDLVRVWSDFEATLAGGAGDSDAAVTVEEHARSLGLVFEMGRTAGVDAPHLNVLGK